MPAARRDLSLAVPDTLDAELLGDRSAPSSAPTPARSNRSSCCPRPPIIDLTEPARARLGMNPAQKNILLRLILRDLEHTLSSGQANRLRDLVYAGLHVGSAAQWATARAESRAAALTKAAAAQ